MKIRTLLVRASLASMLFATIACYTEEPGPAYYEGVDDGTTDLVEISPGIEVIADWDEPIFFADDYYWVYRGGDWYWSTWYGGGWVRTHPPRWISRVPHPESYVHYRPTGWAPHPRIQGGYQAHAQYHATHPMPSGVHSRPAIHGGGGGGGRHR